MIHSLQAKGVTLLILTLAIQIFLADSQRNNRRKPNFNRRQRVPVNIGEFPLDENGPVRRQITTDENGDVYEFHRFQHYGFKTPSPNTYSLESMLAFLAPLATIPIIASAALSSLATILPTLTTEGMVKGRSRREAILQTLDTMSSFNYSTWKSHSIEPNTTLVRSIRDVDIVHKYLKQMDPKQNYNDEVMASYLQCSGMLSASNHCLERLTCQFSDTSSRMDPLEKEVSSLIIFTILNNKHIGEQFKEKMRRAAFFGRDNNGRCGYYACSRTNFGSR